MCDADSYATGLLLTQISAGLSGIGTRQQRRQRVSTSLCRRREAVPVSRNFDEEVEENQDVESGVKPAVPPVERLGQMLRKRNVVKQKDAITISVAKNMKFDF